jgi:tetratricopeptide (TPR) repeat protein
MREGDLARCIILDAQMVECFTQVGDLRHACQQRGNLGYDELMLGANARAERSLRDTVATASRSGLNHITAQAKHNLGLALARQGRLDEAREAEHSALAMFREQGNPRFEAFARNYIAQIEIMAGNYGVAIQYTLDAIALAHDSPTLQCMFRATMSFACAHAGDPISALAHAKIAIDVIAVHGRPEEGDNDVRLAYAEALHATGAHAEARRVILEAETLLREVAAKIGDVEGQRTFLSIPANARTLALANTWR